MTDADFKGRQSLRIANRVALKYKSNAVGLLVLAKASSRHTSWEDKVRQRTGGVPAWGSEPGTSAVRGATPQSCLPPLFSCPGL